MPTNAIFIIFIIALAIASFVLLIFVFYVLRLIKLSTKLKAKQFIKFNASATKNQIVFLGDSLTDFYQVEEFFHDFKIYNRGIASDTTKGVLDRLDSNVIDISPRKVFLQIGTNDFINHKNEYIYNNIIKIVEKLKASLEDAKLYIISLYPVNHRKRIYSRFFTTTRRNKNIIALNAKLKEYCDNTDIKYIDVYNHLTDKKGNLHKDYTVEGLHLSYEGYEVVTEILLPYVKE